MWSSYIPVTDDIIAVSRPLVSVNDLIGWSIRAVCGAWDSGANTIHWVVELEGAVTRRGRRCVGVVFAFPVSMCVSKQYDVRIRFVVCYSFYCLLIAFTLLLRLLC